MFPTKRKAAPLLFLLAAGLILLVLLPFSFSLPAGADWQAEYDRLKAKVDREFDKPTVSEAQSTTDPVGEFVRWMGIKAADRDRANALAAQARNAGNPYWEKKFQDLAGQAQESGDVTLWKGMKKYMKVEPDKGANWEDAVSVCGPDIGRRFYSAAVELGFDKEMVRGQARCLMRFANRDLEYGKFAYYSGRTNYIGTMDGAGVITLPQGDFDVDCERRSFFHVQDRGEPRMPADTAMESGEKIRETCEFYGLGPERQDTTELMEEYLKEKKVLCEMPPGKGHSFFKKLAVEHGLPKAEEHIDGFYGKLRGKVEVENDGRLEPAPGAVVTVTDNEDGRSWRTTAGRDGRYEIKDVILHKNCSPFDIKAEYEGYTTEDSYDGPLEEPDKNYTYEKDLVIIPAAWEGTVEYLWRMKSGKGDSFTTAVLMPGGSYQGKNNWRLRVKFKKDRGNENVEIFALSSAVLETFSSKLDATQLDLQKEGRRVKVATKEEGRLSSRRLGPAECGLELAVNLKRKSYALSGFLKVRGVPVKAEDDFEMVMPPAARKDRESGRGTIDIDETIELGGRFAADSPESLQGAKDLTADIPPEFKDFMRGLAGDLEWTARWDLKKSSKK
jgi:hypothetical protein